MVGGAAVNSRAAMGVVPRHIGRDPSPPHCCHEAGGVVSLLGAERDALSPAKLLDHNDRSFLFGGTGRQSEARRYYQADPVLHDYVPQAGHHDSCQFAFLYSRASGSAIEAWVSLLFFSRRKSHFPLRPGCRRRSAAVFGTEALHGNPGLDHRAIDREVFVRQQRPGQGIGHHLGREFFDGIALPENGHGFL